MLKHEEVAIIDCNWTKDVRLRSDEWETGWRHAKNHSESKNKILHLNQTGSVKKHRKRINAIIINTYLAKLKVKRKNCSGDRYSQE